MTRLLVEKGVSTTVTNDLGYSPKDVIVTSLFAQEFSKLQQQKLARMKTVRPNYSTPDRFKLLKELAEESTTSADDQKVKGLNKNEGRYFRKGLVKESQQKVLKDDQQKDSKRKQEVDQLAKRSAVKNNPLFQQFEKNNLIVTPKKIAANEPTKIINSLVESLRPEEEEEDTVAGPDLLYQQVEATESFYIVDEEEQQKRKSRMRNSIILLSSNDEKQSSSRSQHDKDILTQPNSTMEETSESTLSTSSSEEEEEHEGEEEGSHTPVQIATRLVSPIYHTGKLQISTEEQKPVRPQRSELREDHKRQSGSQKASWTMSMSSWAAILDREFNLSEIDHENKLQEHQRLAQEEKEQEIIIMSSKLELTDKEMEDMMMQQNETTMRYLDIVSKKDNDLMIRPLEKQLSMYDTTATSYYVNRDQNKTTPEKKPSLYFDEPKLDKKHDNETVMSLAATLRFNEFDTPVIPEPKVLESSPPQLEEIPKITSSKSIRRKPITSSFSEPNIQQERRPHQRSNTQPLPPPPPLGYGKLYLHVNGIQDILLPLPKDTTNNRAYVRCVVSDGRFEYMSRYEILEQNMHFDYECVIDTHPDMIITVSLHVRPDYMIKTRTTPFARFLSLSKKNKKKESLSGYVNKEDGAIGQARFALAHMVSACTETVYPAGFHCFNAWYAKSFKERRRKKMNKADVLKVVGNFDVEMLYLPLNEEKVRINKRKREKETDRESLGLPKKFERI